MCSCGEPLDTSHGESYLISNTKIKKGDAGFCCQCLRGFCTSHYGTTIKGVFVYRENRDISLSGEMSFCLECTDLYDDHLENKYLSVEEYAQSYENWAWPFGKMVAGYIRLYNKVPVYKGSRKPSEI